ncbi:MAG TPA: flavin reductase [Bacteroidales bacterium]|nr:MAG: flavin reductase [Bacteroidetes bacterium GWF2_33_38]OFY71458.1 MAG: flavin reductase [Bacteroidetes bacterium RIFOXYA12_FULL_33_9]HBF87372.1 flavin reductase [Bacteroidales bacterium]
MESFKNIQLENISENTFKLIGKDWMLITAGDKRNFNTMTASWGGFGILWNKPVVFIFIRPQRYTYEFMENSVDFTLSFFNDEYKDILKLCGTKSGREINKISGIGLTPIESHNTVAFSEAKLILSCKKLYFNDLIPENFINCDIDKNYVLKDYHRMYIGEIAQCLSK